LPKLRVLTFTTLYPNQAMPTFAMFVEQRLRHLAASGEVEARIVAPVPWFPLKSDRFGSYGRFARVPDTETRHGLHVTHPRYLVVPKVGMMLTPRTLFRAGVRAIEWLRAEGFDFDLIDAHYLYPDGVSAAMLARKFRKPLVLTARGTDVNVIAKMPRPGRVVLKAIEQADAVITVSAALRDALISLGAGAAKITAIRNGVDTTLFRETGRDETRRRLGLDGRVLLSVGNLIPLKGHDLVIRALTRLPNVKLLIAGAGPMRSELERLAAEIGVADCVQFLGAVPQLELPAIYSAADALVLASNNEGLPNVILESIACGTPVIATQVGGIPEVITARGAGLLLPERSDAAIAEAVTSLFTDPPSRDATRAQAQRFQWSETTAAQLALFREILGRQAAIAP
jgi:glycosyltransferase involved in cell wall biosynthesis